MAWIESHQSLSRHRKTMHAVALLGIDKHKLIGHLHELWWWALDNADMEGRLGQTPAAVIAMGAEWPIEDAERFVDALIQAGFMERDDGGGLVLHDWWDYAGRLGVAREDGRKGNHERWHVQRGISDPNCRYCRPDIGGDSGATSGPNRVGTSDPESTNLPTNLPNREKKLVKDTPPSARVRAREGLGGGGGTATPLMPPETMKLLTDNIPNMAVPGVIGSMQSWASRMGWPLVTRALQDGIAAKGKQTSWSYVEAILKRWTATGIKTITDLEEQEAARDSPGGGADDEDEEYRDLSRLAEANRRNLEGGP